MNFIIFFFNDTATTEIYTLSLHDALPISRRSWGSRTCTTPSPLRDPIGRRFRARRRSRRSGAPGVCGRGRSTPPDRKSTRLNSSHLVISYAVFCLKKKKNEPTAERHYTPL